MDHSAQVYVIGRGALTIDDLVRLSKETAIKLQLDRERKSDIDRARSNLVAAIRDTGSKRLLYGITTGFADNREVALGIEDQSTLQENLIRSHASGFGDPIPSNIVRGAMVVRAQSLALGHSGVRSVVIEKLCDLYNSGLIPVIPTFGSVGASGDLAPLSHLALALMGEGTFHGGGSFDSIEYDPAAEGFDANFKRAKLGAKEGLALNNGTSFMATWLGLSVDQAKNLLDHARLALAMSLEALFGVTHAFQEQVQSLRPHPGVLEESALLLQLLAGSTTVRWADGERTDAAHRARPDDPQDDYCLRSATVASGAARHAIDHARAIVEIELNSVTDNPLVVEGPDGIDVWSGSHFHGAVLALPADYLRCAISEIASVSERRIAKLVDRKRNYGLPNYLVGSVDSQGIESGWMMAQYTAASMVNQLKTRCAPYGVDSIPTGNNAEDYVSMGANATRATYESLNAAIGVIAIELLTAARALHLRIRAGLPASALSPCTRRAMEALVEANGLDQDGDRPLAPEFAKAANLVRSRSLLTRVLG